MAALELAVATATDPAIRANMAALIASFALSITSTAADARADRAGARNGAHGRR